MSRFEVKARSADVLEESELVGKIQEDLLDESLFDVRFGDDTYYFHGIGGGAVYGDSTQASTAPEYHVVKLYYDHSAVSAEPDSASGNCVLYTPYNMWILSVEDLHVFEQDEYDVHCLKVTEYESIEQERSIGRAPSNGSVNSGGWP